MPFRSSLVVVYLDASGVRQLVYGRKVLPTADGSLIVELADQAGTLRLRAEDVDEIAPARLVVADERRASSPGASFRLRLAGDGEV